MRIAYRLMRVCSGVQRPPNPTMEESFGTKFSKEQIDKFMNPKGFLDPKEYEKYEAAENAAEAAKEKAEPEPASKQEGAPERDMKEYGFKIKGLEPTRYGDWERNGRCFDF